MTLAYVLTRGVGVACVPTSLPHFFTLWGLILEDQLAPTKIVLVILLNIPTGRFRGTC